jgi:uncharacterized protein YneF (UPF0154 family)
MELLALINALVIVGAFVGGFYVAKKQFTDVVTRLTQQNNELLGSVFHRIGFKPEKVEKTEPSTPLTFPPTPLANADTDDDQPQPKPVNGFPDLFARRNEAFAKQKRLDQIQGIE